MRWGSALAGAAGATAVVIGGQTYSTRGQSDEHQDLASLALSSAEGATVPRGADGHFWAMAEINGAQVRTLVDTGSTLVALTLNDALATGVPFEHLTFDHPIETAAGSVNAAKIRLVRVRVGDVVERQVDAIVVPSGLKHSLLGMSFLNRLSRFEATADGLYLRQ